MSNFNKYNWIVLDLYSNLPIEEQNLALKPVEKGKRKIVLSTNIAESSLTVPDAKYGEFLKLYPMKIIIQVFFILILVIDMCLTKYNVYDYATNSTQLTMQLASQDQATQRSGRVGRVGSGVSFRFVKKEFYVRQPNLKVWIVSFITYFK
jgi:ATP-dependent RNA helicase TDRD9